MVSVSTTTDRYCKFELAHDLSKKAQSKAKKEKRLELFDGRRKILFGNTRALFPLTKK